jgi:hypothetical protein
MIALVLTAVTATTAFAGSTFQTTCSEVQFAYGSGNTATITAKCLNSAGTAVSSSLTLNGISNQSGKLVQGSGASTFQQSCGNIQIQVVDSSNVNLTALCRTSSGSSSSTSLPLNGISNQNGKLVQN